MRSTGLCWLLVVLLAVLWSGAVSIESARSPSAVHSSEEIVFSSDSELADHLQTINARKSEKTKSRSGADTDDEDEDGPSEEETARLRKELLRARLHLKETKDTHGRVSSEYARALHKVGMALHKLQLFDEALDIAKEIVLVHEKLDGVEHLNTANALSNVGAAAFRLKRKQDCQWAMERALYILIKLNGAESNEVLMHRGRMLTYHVPNAKTSSGLSYEDYTYEL